MTTIVLADDHPIVRKGLRSLLEAEQDLVVVGEAGDGREAVALVERLKPSILIVDLRMPGIDGAEVTREAGRRAPYTRVLVLSMHSGEGYVTEALTAGATGYVLKNADMDNLVLAVREVGAGRRYLSPSISSVVVDAYLHKRKDGSSDPYETLTRRERQVLKLVAEGRHNPDIAAELAISPRTVENHRASLMRKLAFKSQADLIRYALRRGLLPVEE